ncbi:MAG: hypothetical protein HYX47_23515 [Burkholderiales bacterium]|nr:hypothetical protein [Burkholderiales bacterium]
MRNTWLCGLWAILVASLAACGGGGGGGIGGEAAAPAGNAPTIALVAGRATFGADTIVKGTVTDTGAPAVFNATALDGAIAALDDGSAIYLGGLVRETTPEHPRVFRITAKGLVTPLEGSWNHIANGGCTAALGCPFFDRIALGQGSAGKALLFQSLDNSLSIFGATGVERTLSIPQMTAAPLNMDRAGSIYFWARDGALRRLEPDGGLYFLGNRQDVVAQTLGNASAGGQAVDGQGNVYVAEVRSGIIRKVSPGGAISDVAGLRGGWLETDDNGNLYAINGGSILKQSPGGAVEGFLAPAGFGTDPRSDTVSGLLETPWRMAVGPQGMWVTGPFAISLATLPRRPAGLAPPPAASGPGRLAILAGQSQFGPRPPAGTLAGTGAAVRFTEVAGVAALADGSALAVATLAGSGTRLFSIAPDGVVTPLAGSWNQRAAACGTLACSTPEQLALATAPSGKAYLFEARSSTIHVFGAAGVESQFTLPEMAISSPLAVDGTGTVYFMDNTLALRKRNPDGTLGFLAGGTLGSTDAIGIAAQFRSVSGLAVDAQGNVYVADNATIRKVTPSGLVSTLAGPPGSPGAIGSANGTGAAARFSLLASLAIDTAGNLYAADPLNGAIRKITSGGVVTTLSAKPDALFNPRGLALAGNALLIGEWQRISRLPLVP